MLNTWLTRELRIDLPLLGAPMANRSGGALAAAVSAGGGFGLLGVGHSQTPAFVEAEAELVRAAGQRFGAGLMCWAMQADRSAFDAVLAQQPAVVLLSFGDPAAFVPAARQAGALVGSQVNTVEDLRVVERAGVDFVIVQGGEAGGHTGRSATLPLLQRVLDLASVPVLAAGGIATGRGLAAVLAAGAAGAMIGTSLLASEETAGPDWLADRIIAAGAADTVYTSVFDRAQAAAWPARWGGRALRNAFLDSHVDAADEVLRADFEAGNPAHAPVYAGEAVELVETAVGAAEVVRRIGAEAEERLRAATGLLD